MEIGVGRAVHARRKMLGLSRAEVAEQSGVSYPYLAEIENGNKEPTLATLRMIGKVLGWDLRDVFAVAEAEAGAWPLPGLTTR